MEPHLLAATAARAVHADETARPVQRRRAISVATTLCVARAAADPRWRGRRGVRLDRRVAAGAGRGLVARRAGSRSGPFPLAARRAGVVPGALQPQPGPAGHAPGLADGRGLAPR